MELALELGRITVLDASFNKLTTKQNAKRNSKGNSGSNQASGNFVKRPTNGSF